jgi:hypothetical protein
VHERQHTGQTMSQVMAAFRERFNKAPPRRATLLDWKKRTFVWSVYSDFSATLYRVRQKYLTIFKNSCEWNRWRGELDLERPSSEAQSISVAMERWSVQHRAFAVETYFKNNDSVLTQRIFRRHFNIYWNECP